jgi:hypothetical protein
LYFSWAYAIVELISTQTNFHNGDNVGLALDDYIPITSLMRFSLRHICMEEQNICTALGIEIKTKIV